MRFPVDSVDLKGSPPTRMEWGGEEIWLNGLLKFFRLGPGKSSGAYCYPDHRETYAVLIGHPKFVGQGYAFDLNPGESITFGPGQAHRVENETDENVLIVIREKGLLPKH